MSYNIVIASDSQYMQHAAAMLSSLFETNPSLEFNIFLLTDTVSEKQICHSIYDVEFTLEQRLRNLCRNYGASFELCVCDLEPISDLPVGQWSTFMYLKLFIPKVLPSDVHKCLFLDVDMIINDDITPLYNIDLKDAVLAACEDIPDCIEHKRRLKLRENDYYINSGVIVIDLEKWRHMESIRPIFDYTRSIAGMIMNEQDVLACYFNRNIHILPIRWNMVTFYFMQQPKIFKRYLNELYAAKRQPAIIHFASPIKPWFRDCTHPYKQLYIRYLHKTLWPVNDVFPYFEELSSRQRINKRVKHLLCKLRVMKDPLYLSV